RQFQHGVYARFHLSKSALKGAGNFLVAALNVCRIGDTPVGLDGIAHPQRATFTGGGITDGNGDIEWYVFVLVPRLRARRIDRHAVARQYGERIVVDLAGGETAGAEC